MAVIVEQDDVGQELYTRDHGIVKVDQMSFQDGGFHIVRTPSGAYMHSNGLPVKEEKELRAAVPPEFLDDALEWFNNRHAHLENKPRAIGFKGDGTPMFDDGTIPDFDDLYAFFKPGPILTGAILALQQHKDAQAGANVKATQASQKKQEKKIKATKKAKKSPPPKPPVEAQAPA